MLFRSRSRSTFTHWTSLKQFQTCITRARRVEDESGDYMNDLCFANEAYKLLEQIKEAAVKWENGSITSERMAELTYGLTNKGNISVPRKQQ